MMWKYSTSKQIFKQIGACGYASFKYSTYLIKSSDYITTYPYKSHASFIFQKATHNHWVTGIKVCHKFTRKVWKLHAYIEARPEALIPHPHLIIKSLKLSTVQLNNKRKEILLIKGFQDQGNKNEIRIIQTEWFNKQWSRSYSQLLPHSRPQKSQNRSTVQYFTHTILHPWYHNRFGNTEYHPNFSPVLAGSFLL